MDHITQLKKIRAEAIARLRNSEDFRLAGKLGQLIVELGDTVEDVKLMDDVSVTATTTDTAKFETAKEAPRPFDSVFAPKTEPEVVDAPSLDSEEIIDELVAEIEGDAKELDALMAEEKSKPSFGDISSYFKTDKSEAKLSNGAAH